MSDTQITPEDIVRQEVHRAIEAMRDSVESPEARAAVAAMAADMALLPLRAARGEDVVGLAAALKAEAMNRTLEVRARAQSAAQQAWSNVVWRILALAIGPS